MVRILAFMQDGGAGTHAQLAGLEALDEVDLVVT
jgi:hypothetical protein